MENVGAYMRAARTPCPVPQRARLGMSEREDGTHVRLEARFATAEEASEARACAARLVEGYSSNLLVDLYGLSGPLERIDLVAEETTLRGETELRYSEMRVIFGLLRGLLERPPPPRAPTPAPEPAPAPAAPSEPPPSPFE